MKKMMVIGMILATQSMFAAEPVGAEVYTLWAGQHKDVGTVTIENDGDTLYVTYKTSGGWELVETHVHAAVDPSEIPQTKPNKKGEGGGNPIPGAFQFSDPPTDPTIQTYEISLSEIGDSGFDPEGCDNLFVAAHAQVIHVNYDCAWQIGDEEASQMDNPADEFDSSPSNGPYDFYVGATPDSEFPRLSKYDSGLANPIHIHFNANMPYGGDFFFSWSPGASGTETFTITLDGTETLGTITRSGASNPAWWGAYERFIDSVEVPPITGDHVLTIRFSRGDGAFWDWLRLEGPCVQEESAWAGDIDFPGENWAAYCNYISNSSCDGIPVHMLIWDWYTGCEIDEIPDVDGFLLEQVDCGDIGRSNSDFPCYYGCEKYTISSNFDVKLRPSMSNLCNMDIRWDVSIFPDVIPGDGQEHEFEVCVKVWRVNIEGIECGDVIQVGCVNIAVEPSL